MRAGVVLGAWLAALVTLTGVGGGVRAQGRAEVDDHDVAVRGEGLSLEEVLASVDRHHPPLEALEARVAAAEGARLAADGGFDPVLGARGLASLGYYRYARADVSITAPTPLWGASFVAGWRMGRSLDEGDFPAYYRYDETLDLGEVRAGVTVPLLRDGPIDARRAAIARAGAGVEAAEREWEARRLRVHLAASEAWARWVAAGLKREVAEGLLELAETRDAQLAARVAAGAIPAFERLENQRAVLERRQGVVTAVRALERAAIALSLYLRDDAGAPHVVPATRLPPRLAPDRGTLGPEHVDLDAALARRPELARFSAQLEGARVAVELAENQVLPRLDLTLTGSYDLGSTDDSALRSQLGAPIGEGTLTLGLPLLLREGLGRAAAARADRAALESERELARDQITLEVRDARSALGAALAQVALAEESAEIAEQVASGERARFEAGATTLFIVNLRETTSAAARGSLLDALADLAVARALLAAVVGGTTAE